MLNLLGIVSYLKRLFLAALFVIDLLHLDLLLCLAGAALLLHREGLAGGGLGRGCFLLDVCHLVVLTGQDQVLVCVALKFELLKF